MQSELSRKFYHQISTPTRAMTSNYSLHAQPDVPTLPYPKFSFLLTNFTLILSPSSTATTTTTSNGTNSQPHTTSPSGPAPLLAVFVVILQRRFQLCC